jgi:gliding motility-associated-like protein
MTERITTIRGQNGEIWVVTHELNSNRFLSYKVTSSGLDVSPVSSAAGSLHGNSCDAIGYMKISLDGKKLALAVSNCLTPTPVDRVEIFNFDDATGKVTPLSKPFSNSIPNAYGIEFSPNNRFLYVSSWYQEGKLYQFDLSSQDIAASKKLIGTTVPFGDNADENCFGALQLAVDGKIYIAKNKQKNLAVINKPDEAACDFKDNAFDLGAKTSGLGLPTFIQSYFSVLDVNEFVFKNYCLSTINDTVKFVTPSIVGLKSILWEFGDGDTDTKFNTYHIYKSFGAYNAQVTVEYVDGSTATFGQTIQIAQGVAPPKNLKSSYGFCENEPTVELDATSETAGVTYEWRNSNGDLISTNPKIKYSQEDILTIQIELGSCSYRASIPVARFKFDFGPDRELCQGDSLKLSPGLPSSTVYAWYFQEKATDPLIKVSEANYYVAKKAGIYTLLAGLGKCSWIDDIRVTYSQKPLPQVKITGDLLFCSQTILKADVLNPTTDAASFVWYQGKYDETSSPVGIGATLTAYFPGKYYVVTTRAGCSVKDSIIVSKVDLVLPLEVYLCFSPTVLDAEPFTYPLAYYDPAATYEWKKVGDNTFLKNTRTLAVTETGTYTVKVVTFGCTFSKSVEVLPKPALLTLPKLPTKDAIDTAFCANEFPVSFDASDPSDVLSYSWKADNTILSYKPKVQITQPGLYNLSVVTGCERKEKTFVVRQISPIYVNLKPVTYTCPGEKKIDPRVTNSYNVDAIYTWTNEKGDTLLRGNELTASILSFTKEGIYTVNIKNKCFEKSSTTRVVFIQQPVLKANVTKEIETCKDLVFKEDILQNPLDDITYSWTLQGIKVSDSLQITFKKSGIYTLTATNGCGSVSHNIKVIYYDAGKSKLSPSFLKCPGDSTTLFIESDTVNSFLWTRNGQTIGNRAFVKVKETGVYTVVVSNKCGSATFSTEVIDKPAINADFDPFLQACGKEGSSFDLKVIVKEPEKQGKLFYKWLYNNVLFANTDTSVVSVNKSGNYTVLISNGCLNSEISRNISISYGVSPQVSITGDMAICPDQTTTLTAKATHTDPNATFLYRWDNNPNLNTAVLQNASFGTHFVDVVVKNCTQRTYITIDKPVLPSKIDLGRDSTFCKDNPYVLTIPKNSDYQYKWLRNGVLISEESSITFTESGTYKLIISDGCGNFVEDEIGIEALSCLPGLPPGECPFLYIPNMFTPNNDGKNETFAIRCMEGINWHLTVYNRLGKTVYENKNYDNSWSAQNIGNGLYYFTLLSPKTGKLYNGWVEIVR